MLYNTLHELQNVDYYFKLIDFNINYAGGCKNNCTGGIIIMRTESFPQDDRSFPQVNEEFSTGIPQSYEVFHRFV